MTVIPAVEVGRQYLSDPDVDELIRGDEVQDGMVVLVADSIMRGSSLSTRSLETDRWCRVSKIRMTRRHNAEPLLSFVGTYADGSQFPRTYSSSYFWYVKKASVTA